MAMKMAWFEVEEGRQVKLGRPAGARVGRVVSASRDGLLFLSPPARLRLTPTPALVARAQGGLTLGPERGEVGADFPNLGSSASFCLRS